ncbi:hypothetical protein L3Q82_011545, partial [Scortum barcoo]
WVDAVWDSEFTERKPLDDITEEELSVNGDEAFGALYQCLLAHAADQSADRDGASQSIWATLGENGVSVKSLVAVLSFFVLAGKAKMASVQQRVSGLHAASLYLLLLGIPGSIANKVFHEVLLDTCSDLTSHCWPQDAGKKRKKDVLKSSQAEGKRSKPQRKETTEMDIDEAEEEEEELHFSVQDLKKIRDAVVLLVESLLRLLQTFPLKNRPQSASTCTQIFSKLLYFEPVIGDLTFAAVQDITKLRSVPEMAFYGLQLLCSPKHGDQKESLRMVFHRLLYVILMMNKGNRGKPSLLVLNQAIISTRDWAIQFVCTLLRIQEGARYHRLVEDLQQLLADVEGRQPSEEVQAALSFPAQSVCVGSPVQFIIQLHSQVFVGEREIGGARRCMASSTPCLLPVSKLQRVKSVVGLWPQVMEQQPFHGLHHVRRQGDRPEVIQLTRMWFLGDWNDAGCLPQLGDPPLSQAQDLCVCDYSHLVDELKELVLPFLKILLQHICFQMVEKSEFRSHGAQAVGMLTSQMADTDYACFIKWLFNFSRHSKMVHRLFSVDVVMVLLEQPERKPEECQDTELACFLPHKFLIQNLLFARRMDDSPTVQGHALACLAQCLELHSLNLGPRQSWKVKSQKMWILVSGSLSSQQKTYRTLPFRTVEISSSDSSGCDAKENLALLLRRVKDSKTNVRKSALQALVGLLKHDVIPLSWENLATLSERCRDPAVSVKKKALQCVGELLVAKPECRVVQKAWLQGVVPAVVDSENSVQDKAMEALDQVLLSQVKPYSASCHLDAGQRLTWDLLGLLCDECQNLSRYFSRAFTIWSKQKKFTQTFITDLISHTEADHAAGAWLLLSKVVASSPVLPYGRILDTWDSMVSSKDVTVTTCCHILCVIGDIAAYLNEDTKDRIVNDLMSWLKTFTLSLEVISAAVETLHQLGRSEDIKQTQAFLNQHCGELVSVCEAYLAGIILSEKGTQNLNEELMVKHLHTLGVASLHCPAMVGKRTVLLVESVLTTHSDKLAASREGLRQGTGEENLADSSTLGFRRFNACFVSPGRGTLDQLYTLCRVLEGLWEFAQPVHMCFVDLEKAFNRVPRGILWGVLRERSQGPEGVRFGNHRISSLLFADDVVLLASSSQDLQRVLERFAAECEAAGMRISTSKSEAMVLDRKRVACPLRVGGEVLPQVEEFKYLGVLFTKCQEEMPASLPLSQFKANSLPTRVRAHGVITLGKLCLQHEELVQKYLPVFARELEVGTEIAVRNNVVVIMCDLCVRYTNIVDHYIPNISACLRDNEAVIREQTLIMLTNLLQEEFVKWKGSLFFRFMVALVDLVPAIASLCEYCLLHLLLKKNPEMFSQHFIECIFHFNSYSKHKSYNKFPQTEREKVRFSLKGPQHREKRFRIYRFLLENFTDAQRFNITNKINQTVLACFADEELPLDADGAEILSETFNVLSLKEMKLQAISAPAGGTAGEDPEEENMATMAKAVLQAAQKKVVSQVQKKAFIENTVPLIISLKSLLEQKRSPVLGDLMAYLQVTMQDYRNEVKEFFSGDEQLAAEVEFALKTAEREREMEEQMDKCNLTGDGRTPTA